jgi:hypothetical protein
MAQSHNARRDRPPSSPTRRTSVVRTSPSPSPWPSPLGRGNHQVHAPRISPPPHSPSDARRFSLSLRERAGVRGNRACSSPTSQTLAGTVKLLESSGKAGGFPAQLTLHVVRASALSAEAACRRVAAGKSNPSFASPRPCGKAGPASDTRAGWWRARSSSKCGFRRRAP